MHHQSPLPAAPSALSPADTSPLTIATAIDLVAGWDDLPPRRLRDLTSALSSVGRKLALSADLVPLTPEALRPLLSQPGSAFGISNSSMRNLRSAIRFVLRRLEVIAPREAPIAAEWQALLDKLPPLPTPLRGFARHASIAAIAPGAVDDDTLAGYLVWLTDSTLGSKPRKLAGNVRAAWNRAARGIPGWPARELAPLATARGNYVLPLQAFPAGFQDDIAAFARRLRRDDMFDPDADELDNDDTLPAHDTGPARPLRASTVDNRMAHCRWAASALVQSGVPIEEVTSLACLVTPPGHPRRILDFFRKRAGCAPSPLGGHAADILRMIGRHHARLPEAQLRKVNEQGARVRLKYDGMTAKNQDTLGALQDPARLQLLLHLPDALMRDARKLLEKAPRQAASIALRATAIALLTKIPLRLGNLVGLRLDRHLHCNDPRRRRIDTITIQAAETKNRRDICMPVSAGTADMLDEWIAVFRPHVAPVGSPFLFPGVVAAKRMTPQGMRDALKTCLHERIGVAVTPHQFRHLAAAIFLRACPGQYEAVRQLLGNSSLEVVTRHYAGTETQTTAHRFDRLIDDARTLGAGPALPLSGTRKGRRA